MECEAKDKKVEVQWGEEEIRIWRRKEGRSAPSPPGGLHLQQQHLEDRLRPPADTPISPEPLWWCTSGRWCSGPVETHAMWHICWPSPTLKPVQWTGVFYLFLSTVLQCCSYQMCWECTVCHRVVGVAWRDWEEYLRKWCVTWIIFPSSSLFIERQLSSAFLSRIDFFVHPQNMSVFFFISSYFPTRCACDMYCKYSSLCINEPLFLFLAQSTVLLFDVYRCN